MDAQILMPVTMTQQLMLMMIVVFIMTVKAMFPFLILLYPILLPYKISIIKYLNMAYENIGKEKIEKYHGHPEKDTRPEFFYCRDIIKAYESSLNQ